MSADKLPFMSCQFDSMAKDMPVGLLDIEGIRAWPLVAGYLLHKYFYDLEIFSREYKREIPPVIEPCRLQEAELRVCAQIRELPCLGDRGCLSFMLRGDSRLRIDGACYNHLLDPLWEKTAEREPGVIIETTWGWGSSPAVDAADGASRRLLPTHVLDSHPFVMRAAERAPEWQSCDLLTAPTSWLREHGLAANDEAQVLELREASMFLGAFAMCRLVLQRVRPRFVMVCGFNGYHAAGMTAAARSLSIPVMDVMDAPRSPEEGSSLRHISDQARRDMHVFTDFIWVHNPASKAIMMEQQCYRDHQVFIGNSWRDKCLKTAADSSSKLPQARHRILISLWPGSLMPGFLLRAMSQIPHDVAWLLRLHPPHLNERVAHGWEPGPEEVRVGEMWKASRVLGDPARLDGPVSGALMKRYGVQSWEIIQSSTLPLYAVLPHVVHHVTAHSTVAVDAADFGIRTTFIDPNGAAYFPGLIAEGSARLCLDEHEVLAHVRESLSLDIKPRFRDDGSPSLDSEISALLRATGALNPSPAREAPRPAPVSMPLPESVPAASARPGTLTSRDKLKFTTISCQACGSGRWLKLRIPPQENAGQIQSRDRTQRPQWSVCRDCGFVCQNPRPCEGNRESARRSAEGLPSAIDEATKVFAPMHLRRLDPWLNSLGIDLGRRQLLNCLDYGCGIAGALEHLAAPGRKMWGVEPDEQLARYGREHFDIEIRGGLEDLPADVDFDFIFTHHALQRVPDPRVFFRFCKKHLKRKNGLVLVVAPTWRYAAPQQALGEFNASNSSMFDHVSLARFFNHYGFSLMAHRYQNHAGDGRREICALACKSDRPSPFTFTPGEVRHEIEQLNGLCHRARQGGPSRTEDIIEDVTWRTGPA